MASTRKIYFGKYRNDFDQHIILFLSKQTIPVLSCVFLRSLYTLVDSKKDDGKSVTETVKLKINFKCWCVWLIQFLSFVKTNKDD